MRRNRRQTQCVLGLLVAAAGSCNLPVGALVDPGSLTFVAFQDPGSSFSTMDVRDVDGEIVRFDTTRGQLFWVPASLAFDGWTLSGNQLQDGFFTVRFGTENGAQRAYFTETDPATICDIVVQDGMLTILATNVAVPQT